MIVIIIIIIIIVIIIIMINDKRRRYASPASLSLSLVLRVISNLRCEVGRCEGKLRVEFSKLFIPSFYATTTITTTITTTTTTTTTTATTTTKCFGREVRSGRGGGARRGVTLLPGDRFASPMGKGTPGPNPKPSI